MAKLKKSSFYCTGASLCLHAVILLLLSFFWISSETKETKAITVAAAEVIQEDDPVVLSEIEVSLPETEEQFENDLSAERVVEVSISDPAEAVIVEAAHVNAPPSLEVLLQEVVETPVSIPAAAEGTATGTDSDGNGAGGSEEYNGLGTGQGGSVSFFGAYAQANRVVYVLDNSWSMAESVSAGGNRFKLLKKEARRSVNSLLEHMEFNVIFFSNTIEEIDDKGLRSASRENKREVAAWVHTQRMRGGTRPEKALRRALELRPDVIFFLTDGDFSLKVVESITNLNSEYKIPILIIGFGDEQGAQILGPLAVRNGGTYRPVR